MFLNGFKGFLIILVNFFQNYNSGKLRVYGQLIEFKRLYANTLNKKDLDYLDSFLESKNSFFARLSFVLRGNITRSSLTDTIIFILQYLLGKF